MNDDARYLVIDDDPAFCQVLARALKSRDLHADTAGNIADALRQARRSPPSHVVLDLKLGTESGLGLIEPLLALNPGMRILLLTGYASIPTAVDAMRRGAVNYLTKPADVTAILAAFEPDNTPPAMPDDPPSLRRLEWEHIHRVLAEHHGNISAAARSLGMHRRTLQRKLKKRPVRE